MISTHNTEEHSLQIYYNQIPHQLEDMPLDIGYASERVTLFDTEDRPVEIGGQNGKTQLIISVPFIDESLTEELQEIAQLVGEVSAAETGREIETFLIVSADGHEAPKQETIRFLIDKEEAFGDWYGIRLKGPELEGAFTKSLTIISKDGAIFYDEYLQEINNRFNLERLRRKITAAQTCYTGKGCH